MNNHNTQGKYNAYTPKTGQNGQTHQPQKSRPNKGQESPKGDAMKNPIPDYGDKPGQIPTVEDAQADQDGNNKEREDSGGLEQ